MNKSSFRRSLFALTTGVMLLAVLPSAHAQTWSGNASGNNTWGNATNWVGSVAPVANGALTFNGTTQTTTNNDFAANTTFGAIAFTNNGSAGQTGNFTLNGMPSPWAAPSRPRRPPQGRSPTPSTST